MTDTFVGIDPGTFGGIAILKPDGNVYSVFKLPYISNEVDLVALEDIWLETGDRPHVVVEKQQPFGNTSKTISFRMGLNYGLLLGFVRDRAGRLIQANPAKWKREMHFTADKERVWLAARDQWPELAGDILKYKTSGEGPAHALWLAEWGRRQA